VTYSSRLAFSTNQVDRDNLVEASSWEEVQSGETTALLDAAEGNGKTFTPAAISGKGHLITCKNQTSSRSNVGLGEFSSMPI